MTPLHSRRRPARRQPLFAPPPAAGRFIAQEALRSLQNGHARDMPRAAPRPRAISPISPSRRISSARPDAMGASCRRTPARFDMQRDFGDDSATGSDVNTHAKRARYAHSRFRVSLGAELQAGASRVEVNAGFRYARHAPQRPRNDSRQDIS